MSVQYRVGDVFDRLAEIPDGTIDLIVTSPPFLALRSYLPADHPDKHKEIGSEPTPAAFIGTMLALTAEWGRVLAPHGSICVELGDTYAGAGSGGDQGTRQGQNGFTDSSHRSRHEQPRQRSGGTGWPLAKSMSLVPHLYTASLAYGRHLLTGDESPAGQWRIRNVICWARPNPPVGALGDKFRPATSYITVACKGTRRYFDLDAVRTPSSPNTHPRTAAGVASRPNTCKASPDGNRDTLAIIAETNGAPPLDWHIDDYQPEDGDWLWRLPTRGYPGAHYATFPLDLPKRMILAMCPERVCVECGKPSERIAHTSNAIGGAVGRRSWRENGTDGVGAGHSGEITRSVSSAPSAQRTTTGWTDCGHGSWRNGVVLDPFAGSGTTLEAAQIIGRDGIGIDLDKTNADLARDRVGMFLEMTA